MQWQLLSESTPQSLEDLKQILLANRKITDPGSFFSPPNPLEVTLKQAGIDPAQLKKAQKRVLKAIEKQEKIIVFGDYDADGICATAILWETLHLLGAKTLPFIPHREKHGYGLTPAALEELLGENVPDLVITVDTGIVAQDAVQILVDKGVDVIVTDHHQPEETLPPALAVVHSTQVCGAAVAWFFARELDREKASENLELAGIATVTDLMPLAGLNRGFVRFGLEVLNRTKRKGLKALIKEAGLQGKQIEAGHLGFVLGPRINAMGRLAHGMDALRLLCTNRQDRAEELAHMVSETNQDRQELTQGLFELARQQAFEQKGQQIIIVASPEFHEGVIGLIAGRLAQQYAKPAIVMSLRGDIAKASARSVPGVNITDLIRKAREHLIDVGGHPMAAGFGFEPTEKEKIEAVLIEEAALIDPALLQKSVEIDCVLPASLVALKTLDVLAEFAPFGQKNPEPLFVIQDLKIVEAKAIGKEKQHLKLSLALPGGSNTLTALAWRRGEAVGELSVGSQVNVVGKLEKNVWNGRSSLQFILRDLQPAEEE